MSGSTGSIRYEQWPSLALDEWQSTYATLHLWTQIVGKVRTALTPWTNHSWHSTLYVTARGLTTSPIPHDARTFQIDFDLIDHQLLILTSAGEVRKIALHPRSVADFYGAVMKELNELGLDATFLATPNEIPDAIPFEQDHSHTSYDAEAVNRCHRVLVQADRALKQFRARFTGKCSPVHFFWGSFDLAVTRFSGQPAPQHPGGVPGLPDWVTREAYSQEVSSCGFWPGGGPVPYPVFYSYAYPEPEGFSTAPVRPAAASYDKTLREWILPYDEVRRAASPDAVLLEFLQSTYEAAADLGKWDRSALERPDGPPPHPQRTP